MSSRLKDEGRLRAMGRFKNRRMEKSKRESERDSGFSDGSAVDQTDADDDSRSHAYCGGGRSSAGALQGLQPMIIMNNLVLKQNAENSASVKPWFSPSVEVLQQPQVVFLQPVVPHRSTSASKRRRHKKYLPILKSYPRIAPHPHKNSGSSTSSSGSSSTLSIKSSSSCHSERKRKDVTQPLPSNTAAEVHSAEPSPESTESTFQTLEPHSLSDTENKTKRFCNTYNILSKSGLLDITLRTKELIRQNRRTQTELEQLRKDTNLFLEALKTRDSEVWRSLQNGIREDEEKGKQRTMSDGEIREEGHLK